MNIGSKIKNKLQGSGNIPCQAQKKKPKENSHELVVSANALGDIGLRDTDCLWSSETDKQ